MAVGQPERPGKVPSPPRPDVVGWDSFVAGLTEVGLLDAAGVKAFLDRMPAAERPTDALGLARELARAGRLTRYQAAAAVQGRARGLVIGDYLIMEKIGAGGMGTVFKASNGKNGRIVALKVLLPAVTRSSKAIPRLRREAQAAAQLNHPNLVSALDLDEIGGLHVFVMDYVEGRDLSKLVKTKGPMSVDRAIDCVIQAARGLQAAHERGIIHRDVKPANLLLDKDGTVKVLDLGLARVDQDPEAGDGDEYADGLTNPGTVLGTVDYMAPEQAMNSRAADARADIYGLGCSLYYLLHGRPPYRGGGALERLMRHREAPIPSLREDRPEVPPALDAVLARMLAKAPGDRFASMAEVITALAACGGGEGPATEESGLGIAGAPTNDGARETTFLDLNLDDSADLPVARGTPEVSKRARSISRPLLGAAAVVVGVGLVIGYLVFPRSVHDQGRPGDPSATGQVSQAPAVDARLDNADARRPALSPRPADTPPAAADPLVADARPKVTLPLPAPERHEAAKPKPETTAPKPAEVPTIPAPEPFGEARLLAGHTQPGVAGVAVSADGRRALSGGEDRTVRLWDAESGELLATLSGHDGAVNAVAISADGRRGLSGGVDGLVIVWDLDAMTESRRLVGHEGAVRAAALAADGRRAISGGIDRTVRVWDVDAGISLAVLREPQDAVNAVAISADGRRALSGGDDKIVRYWNLEIRKQLRRYKDHREAVRSVALAADGRHALSGGADGRLRLWDLKDPKADRPVWRGEAPGQAIACVAFTPDGRRVLAGTQAEGLVVLDAKTGRERHRYPAPFAFEAVAVPNDNLHVLTSQNDGSVRLWNLPAAAPDALAAGHALTIEGQYPVIHEANALELAAWADRMKRAGFLPTLVNGHDAGGIPRFAALAVKGAAGTPWEIRLDDDADVNKTFRDMVARDFWVVSLSGYPQGTTSGLVSLWIPKTSLPPVRGSFHGAPGLDGAAFEAQQSEQLDKKNRLTALSVYARGAGRLFAALWSPSDGTPARPAQIGLDAEGYHALLEEARRDGQHPISVSAYTEGAEIRFGVVLHHDAPGLRWDASAELGPEPLQLELARRLAQRFRPLLLAGYPRSNASRYLAVWVDDHIQAPKRLGADPASPSKTEASPR